MMKWRSQTDCPQGWYTYIGTASGSPSRVRDKGDGFGRGGDAGGKSRSIASESKFVRDDDDDRDDMDDGNPVNNTGINKQEPRCTTCTAVCLSFGPIGQNLTEGLAQPQACRAGDVSAASCLQVAAGELAAATRLRQARPLSACTCYFAIG